MKIPVASLVGGLIIFIWQFLSWTVLDLHRPALQYTPKQDSILAYLGTQFDSSGGYFLPTVPANASSDDMKKLEETAMHKPWAQIAYHKSYDANMLVNILKALITDIITVLLFCWVVSGFTANSFGKTFLAALFTSLIVFLNANYIVHIWYETFDITSYLTDYLVSWALAGLWLGWWLNKK